MSTTPSPTFHYQWSFLTECTFISDHRALCSYCHVGCPLGPTSEQGKNDEEKTLLRRQCCKEDNFHQRWGSQFFPVSLCSMEAFNFTPRRCLLDLTIFFKATGLFFYGWICRSVHWAVIQYEYKSECVDESSRNRVDSHQFQQTVCIFSSIFDWEILPQKLCVYKKYMDQQKHLPDFFLICFHPRGEGRKISGKVGSCRQMLAGFVNVQPIIKNR